MRRGRGVTLIEVMITLSTFLLFLILSGVLVRKASRVLRFSQGKVSTVRAATVAIDQMAKDVRGAIVVKTPTTGPSSELLFSIVTPNNPSRLFSKIAPPTFPVIDLNNNDNLTNIEFSLNGDRLVRKHWSPPGPAESPVTEFVASEIQTLEFERSSLSGLKIKIGVREEMRVRDLSFLVVLLEGI